jgi:15-cis-phytoene synthase
MEQSKAITQRSASNLALAFVLLPKEKRDGMSALYAFCREVDDVADDESVPAPERAKALAEWREDIQIACSGGCAHFAVNQELQQVIRRHPGLKFELFDDLIRGVEMDLDIKRYANYEELEQYCYRVASVVGLLSIEIFGYQNAKTREYAVYLGKALQLTNIVRDVKTDAERGRIYFPLDELAKFGVSEAEILDGKYTAQYRDLAASVAARAKHFYKLANQTLPREDRRAMAAAELMGSVYWRLLQKLEARQFNVFGPTLTRVSKGQKLILILRTWFRIFSGALVPNYGTP